MNARYWPCFSVNLSGIDFNHLQKRALQLISFGFKRENLLNEAVANAWKLCERISVAESLEQARELASEGEDHFRNVLLEHNRTKVREMHCE